MKTIFLFTGLMMALTLHADVLLTQPEVAQKNLAICQALQTAIQNTTDVGLQLQSNGDASSKVYEAAQIDLVAQFSALACSQELALGGNLPPAVQAVDATIANLLNNSCSALEQRLEAAQSALNQANAKINGNIAAILRKILVKDAAQAEAGALQGAVNKQGAALTAQIEQIRASMKDQGCP